MKEGRKEGRKVGGGGEWVWVWVGLGWLWCLVVLFATDTVGV